MLLAKVKISGHSMEPNFLDDEYVLVSSVPFLFRQIRPRDVVVFRHDGDILMKRIEKIKDNKFFLTGDNSKDSLDSKKIGWVDKKNIVGKVIYKI